MRNSIVLILSALAIAIAVAAFWYSSASPANVGQPLMPAPQKQLSVLPKGINFDKLQEIAESACRCERSGQSSAESCWAGYRTKLTGLAVESESSACAPVQTNVDCVTADGHQTCVTTSFTAGFNTKHGYEQIKLCSPVEAQAIEAADNRAVKLNLNQDEIDGAVRRVWQSILKGEAVVAKGKSIDSCV